MKPRLLTLTGMILLAAASRLIPHPYNFTPITAIALFGGANFSEKRWAFFVPLAAMLLSDLFFEMHSTLPFVYLAFILIVCIGFSLRSRKRVLPIASAALGSSLLFFVVSNFGVWAVQSLYPKTFAGLVTCYVAAIPFFQNLLAGDLLYTAALFGLFALAERLLPTLSEPQLTAG